MIESVIVTEAPAGRYQHPRLLALAAKDLETVATLYAPRPIVVPVGVVIRGYAGWDDAGFLDELEWFLTEPRRGR